MKNQSKTTKRLPSNPRLRKQFSETPYTFPMEMNKKPSLTVPDLTLTIKQLLNNHSRGITSDVGHNEPMYFDTEIPIIDDITDIFAFRNDLKAREKALSSKIKEENEIFKAEQLKQFQDYQNGLKAENQKTPTIKKHEKNENF